MEIFNKGDYLITEDKIDQSQAKFCIIYQGECLVEKNMSLGVNSPYDRSQTVASSSQPVHIAVIGLLLRIK